MENRPFNINVVWLLSQDCIDWKQWESALCLRWDGDTSFIEPSQWQWIHFCQFVVIYQTKIKCLHSIKTKNDVPHLQASASVSAHFPASINKSNQHTADSDRHPMDVRNLVWPVRLRHWVQLTSNQSINQSESSPASQSETSMIK